MYCEQRNMIPVPYMPFCPVLARAYVPYQVMPSYYCLSEALQKGTLYPELFRPYMEKCNINKQEGTT